MDQEKPPPRYAKAGGPPDDWVDLYVIDEETAAEVRDVIEVDCDEGWAICWERDDNDDVLIDPATGDLATQRITGRFRLTYERPETNRSDPWETAAVHRRGDPA